jgi:acyl-homoserine-lactone acylase
VREAAEVLEGWDRHADAESRGAVLFLAWLDEFNRASGGNLFANPWNPEDPLGTPSGLADPGAAVSALDAAAARVRGQTGALDVPFGAVYRVRQDDVDLPGNGFSGPVGTFRSGWYAPSPDGRFHLMGGDTFVLLVDFGDPIQARTALVYGNASQPGSPHRTDQLRLFAEKRLRPVWRTREAVEANLEQRTVLDSLFAPGIP